MLYVIVKIKLNSDAKNKLMSTQIMSSSGTTAWHNEPKVKINFNMRIFSKLNNIMIRLLMLQVYDFS